MSEFLKDPGAAAFLKQLTEKADTTSATAVPTNPEKPSHPVVSSPAITPKPDHQPKIDDGKGGGGNHDNRKGDGGGNDGVPSKKDPFFSRREIRVALLTLLFAVTFGIYVYGNGKILEKMNSIPVAPVLPPVPVVTTQPTVITTPPVAHVIAPSMQAKTVLQPLTFDCKDKSQEELLHGFESATLHQVGDGQSLHVGPGCLRAQVNTKVTRIDGVMYHISVPVPEIPGNYYKCGNGAGERNDSFETCLNFLNLHSGQRVYITIADGGYVNIN